MGTEVARVQRPRASGSVGAQPEVKEKVMFTLK